MSLLSLQNGLRNHFEFAKKVRAAQRFIDAHGSREPIWWVYHPGFGAYVEQFKPRGLLVYDCVDDYSAFPAYQAHSEWLEERERALCRAADLVFTTSSTLYELRKSLNPETHLVHNVGDADHFKQAMDPNLAAAPEVAELEGPVIAFVGAVSDYKLNVDWMLAAALARPNWHFVIIGPVGLADPSTNVSALKKLANVHLLGVRTYAELPSYLKAADVTVIPYRINRYTESVFPIKFFEFMATGKPVVISPLPSCSDYFDSVLVADTESAFISSLDEALTMGDNGRDQRVALAEANSWPKRIGSILSQINRKLSQRPSL
jgi:glycosyltransferase involved in cell wall biosynthesis